VTLHFAIVDQIDERGFPREISLDVGEFTKRGQSVDHGSRCGHVANPESWREDLGEHAHVHDHTRAIQTGQRRLLRANGVTLVRNMGGEPFHLDLRLRKSVAEGALIGPRIVTAGPQLRGGAGTGATPAEARSIVDAQAAAGFDFIEPYDSLPKNSYEAAVAAAAAHFLQQMVRVFRDNGVRMLAGTDYCLFGLTPSFGLHRELQALAAGTDANPLVDIRNASRRQGVVLRGRWLPAKTLDSWLDTLAAIFGPESNLVDEAFAPGGGAEVNPGAT
jgi:hypothetical protein